MFKLNFKKKEKVSIVNPLDKPLYEVFYFVESNKSDYHVKLSNDPNYKCHVLCVHRTNVTYGDEIQYDTFNYITKDGVGSVGKYLTNNFGEYIDGCLNIIKDIITDNKEKIVALKKVNQYRYDISRGNS